jgi:PKD repeat protein
MVKGLAVCSMLAVAAVMAAGCGVHEAASAPSLAGPSQLNLQVNMTASPDRLSLDGGSRSTITMQVLGPNGQPCQVNSCPNVIPPVKLHVDILPNGSLPAFDYGKLDMSDVEVDTRGNAFVVYTAPPLAAGLNQPYSTVSIRAVIVGTDATAAIAHTVVISLVKIGVIPPPADTPTASFVVTPTPVTAGVGASFDASRSCPGPANASGCLPSLSVITNYAWSFGDGATASGQIVNHTFSAAGTYNVTLTVTNDRGVMASTAQLLVVATTPPPTALFTPSTNTPAPDQPVNFNAGASTAAPGHTIARYDWNFGDGATGSGINVIHTFHFPGVFTVTLTVTDDVGQRGTASQSMNVALANPTARLTVTKTVGLTIVADGSQSTGGGSGVISNYNFTWGDGTNTQGPNASVSHMYLLPNTYSVTLTVTDNNVPPRTGSATAPAVTVP